MEGSNYFDKGVRPFETPSSDELEAFVTEYSPDDREVLETRILEKKAEYENRKQTQAEKLFGLKLLMEDLKRQESEEGASLEEMKSKLDSALLILEDLEISIEAKKMKIFGGLINFIEIQKTRKTISELGIEIKEIQNKLLDKETKVRELQDEFGQVHELLSNYEQNLKDESELGDIEKMFEEFTAVQTERWRQHEEIKQMCKVEQICQDYNAVVVHTFQDVTTSAGGNHFVNSPLKNGGLDADFVTRLKILIAFQGDVSASTLRIPREKEDSNAEFVDETWTKVGVIIGKGEVHEIGAGDTATTVKNGKRTSNKLLGDRISKDDLEASINRPGAVGGYGYNELTVSKPEPRGVFMPIIPTREDVYSSEACKKQIHLSPEEYYQKYIQKIVNNNLRNLIQYATDEGLPIYFRDEKTNIFYSTTISPENGLPQKNEKVSLSKLLESPPVGSSRQQQIREEFFDDCPFNLEMDEKRIYDTIKNVSKFYELLNEQIDLEGRIDFAKNSDVREIRLLKNSSLLIGDLNYSFTTPLENINDFPIILKEILENLDEDGMYLKKVIFFSHKLASLFEGSGRTEVAVNIRDVVNNRTPIEEYNDFTSRRIGKNGGFRMTEADLSSVSS